MKILYFKWNSYGAEDIQAAFESLGNVVSVMPYSKDDVYRNDKLQKTIIDKLHEEAADVAFSSNYYPPIAEACHDAEIPYISWIYDSPHVMLYSYTTIYETNHIYVFDKELYEEFAGNRINTVHYMPLAANPVRLRSLIEDQKQQEMFKNSKFYNKADIAFVGAMYDEKHTFFRRLHSISDYTRGYLEGIIAVQRNIWGYNLIQGLMREDIMDDMSQDIPMKPNEDSVAKREYLFAEYCINREITARERLEYITGIGERFSGDNKPILDIYTKNVENRIKGTINHGFIDPYTAAPFVYDKAKINLNITLRSIHTGIPLRVFEILGSGGFLLSNYQADFADCYIDGEDYVSYSSKEDMFDKIEYYLSHEKERAEIAENGLRRTMNDHTYEERLKLMLESIQI